MTAVVSAGIVFLDKDGTLVVDVPHNIDATRVELVSGGAEALALLANAGLDIVIITNQPGVAFGWFPEDALDAVELRIAELILPFGVRFRGFYYCPHHPGGIVPEYAVECDCRKPRSGLLTKAATDLRVDLARSWMVGDILDDIEAGRRAGCRTVLVNNGDETEWLRGPLRQPDIMARDLAEAARAIIGWPPSEKSLTPGSNASHS